jgi:hypothetical protein
VAEQGFDGNPSTGGIMSSNGRNNLTVQLGGRGKNWGAAALYRYGTCNTDLRRGTPMATADLQCNASVAGNNASSNSIGLGAYWQPLKTGWIPSVSLGWGYTGFSQSAPALTSGSATSNNGPNGISNVSSAQSWAVMFQWNDAFAKGNAAGFAFGQGVMTTGTRFPSVAGPNDSNYAFEWFYRFRVTDKISVSPAIFYLSNPNGQRATGANAFNATGILVQTRFKF